MNCRLKLLTGIILAWATYGTAEDVKISTPAASNPADFQRIGWNARVRQQFMHPPVFRYTPREGAAGYHCTVRWKDAKGCVKTTRMDSRLPEFDLAQVWGSLPASGPFEVITEAVNGKESVLATSNSACRRKAPFAGPYRSPQCGYGQSATKAVKWLLRRGDSGTEQYPYPVLLYSSYIRLLTAYARLHPQEELGQQALIRARKYGDDMLHERTPADGAYADLPRSHGDPKVLQICRAGMAGDAFLDLYDASRDKTYLEAALCIANTLQKTQLPEGRWYFRVEPRTGKVLGDYTSDQAEAILLLDRLIGNHDRKDLEATRDKAVHWMLENPCETFLWQQQWDDVPLMAPYENLSWFDTALFAEYLLRRATPENGYEKLAAELVRYIDDQFVEWEPTENFITPGVREQYKCYYVIDWHGGHYIGLCLAFHARTHRDIWLKKARAIADTLTAVQHPDGFYPTWMHYLPRPENSSELKKINYNNIWPNCTAYSAEMLLELGQYLKGDPATK